MRYDEPISEIKITRMESDQAFGVDNIRISFASEATKPSQLNRPATQPLGAPKKALSRELSRDHVDYREDAEDVEEEGEEEEADNQGQTTLTLTREPAAAMLGHLPWLATRNSSDPEDMHGGVDFWVYLPFYLRADYVIIWQYLSLIHI